MGNHRQANGEGCGGNLRSAQGCTIKTRLSRRARGNLLAKHKRERRQAMMPQWESKALALITGAGVSTEDAPWVLECIQKAADDIAEMDDADQFPLFMEYHGNDRAALCNLSNEAFADVLACLGIDLHRLETLWERKHIDPPIDDWSME